MTSHTNDHKTAEPARDQGATIISYVDELGRASDAIDGVAAILDTMAESVQYDDHDRHAFTNLSDTLYQIAESVSGVRMELDAMAQRAPRAAGDRLDVTADVRLAIGEAEVDALSAKESLIRLASLVVAGELDVTSDAGTDAFECFAAGIAARIGEVAATLGGIAYSDIKDDEE